MRYLKDYELENMGKLPSKNKPKKMAKDRFSKFKKSNYNKEFRWGNHNKILNNRLNLNKEQKDWLIKLRASLTKQSSINFIDSILEQNYVPTDKQKEIIKSIKKNG